MLTGSESWLVEESALDEPADLLTIPEIKQHVIHDFRDDGLGLWSLLERPESVSGLWAQHQRKRKAAVRNARRQRHVLRAA